MSSPERNAPEPRLPPGALWETADAVGVRALASGALEPLGSHTEIVEADGIGFVVRILEGSERKVALTHAQRRAGHDPFLPHEEALHVGRLSDTHRVLLNKFNVLHHHLLLVTCHYERQEAALSASDLAAMWRSLREREGLAFYNGGRGSGASQPHKHLQWVPIPLGPGPDPTPWLREAAAGSGRSPHLPFRHAVAPVPPDWIEDPEAGGAAALPLYRELLEANGCTTGGDPAPYSLIATRDWWAVVARRTGSIEGIPVNSLGYAGGLLARNEAQLARIRERGPLDVLLAAAWPW